jgi:hypothetical protein
MAMPLCDAGGVRKHLLEAQKKQRDFTGLRSSAGSCFEFGTPVATSPVKNLPTFRIEPEEKFIRASQAQYLTKTLAHDSVRKILRFSLLCA